MYEPPGCRKFWSRAGSFRPVVTAAAAVKWNQHYIHVNPEWFQLTHFLTEAEIRAAHG